MSQSCHSSCHGGKAQRRDYFFLLIILASLVLYGTRLVFLWQQDPPSGDFFHIAETFFRLLNVMAWGIALGIVFVGLLAHVPREYVTSVLGRPGSKGSLVRATLAGVMLDLCSHGILMVGMKLYERGASHGQVMAFLIASPWNSLSLSLILISLVGLPWTLAFIVFSMIIALVTGLVFEKLVERKVLPPNPHRAASQAGEPFSLWKNARRDLRHFRFSKAFAMDVLVTGLRDSKMILKWVLFGALLSSLIATYVDDSTFQQYFGATWLGISATLFFATIIEVCSEGAAPLASDLINRASAPGNSFVFLMAGVSTDYTEIMALRETTRSWKVAFFLPLVTIPQILFIGILLNAL